MPLATPTRWLVSSKYRCWFSLGLASRGNWGGHSRCQWSSSLGTTSASLPHCASIDLAEALALHRGLLLANEAGFRLILLESDSLLCFRFLTQDVEYLSEVGCLLTEIHQRCSLLGLVRFTFTHHEDNVVAHKLVQMDVVQHLA